MSGTPAPSIVAAAQMTATDDIAANLAICKELGADAAARGSALLLLPECFAFLGRHERDKLAVAEVLDPARPGRILSALQEIASRRRLWVIGGGMPEVESTGSDRRDGDAADGGPGGNSETRAWNTAVVVAPDGHLAARYRKIHLFDAAIVGKAELRESSSTARGDEVVTVATPVGRVGLSICYDLRFPELYRKLAGDGGADILVVPAAFTAFTGAAHWHVLLRARAIENQCYVVAAGQVGQHHPARQTFGHSLVIDPWGTVVSELADGSGLAVAEIDRALLARVRSEMPCGQHRVLR